MKQIDEGLLKAVTSAPGNFMVHLRPLGTEISGLPICGTTAGRTTGLAGRGCFPWFLWWFMTPELYPSKSWIQKYKIPDDWSPFALPETVAMTLKCEAYVATTEMLRKVLGENWRLPVSRSGTGSLISLSIVAAVWRNHGLGKCHATILRH